MRTIALLITLLNTYSLFAQDTPAKVQPTIMVIPTVKADQDLRSVLEEDLNLRVAVAEVKSGFDQQEISTIDFVAKLRQMQKDDLFSTNTQRSVKQEMIEQSGADIYVEVESQVILTDKGNSVTLILSAYDAVSGKVVANKVANSPKFYTENYEKLTQKAAGLILDDFVSEVQKEFEKMNFEGQSIAINFDFATSSVLNMNSEIGTDMELLSDLLERWMEDNAFKGYYHIQGITTTKMIFDEVRIPLLESKTQRRYTPSRFGRQLRRYLRSLELSPTLDIQGNKLFVTFN